MSNVSSPFDCQHLAHFFPPQLVVQWFEEASPDYQWRDRLLPRPVLFLGFLLYTLEGFGNLAHAFSDATARLRPDQMPHSLSQGSVSPARNRLPLEVLTTAWQYVLRLVSEATPPSPIEGYSVLCLDGTTFSLADTPENEAAFGRLSGGGGKAAFCSVRSVLVMDAASHLFVAERHGACDRRSEASLADELLGAVINPGVLLEADRLFLSYRRLKRITALGGDALIRAKKNLHLPVLKELSDGSYLSRMYDGTKDKDRDRSPIQVRVISYAVVDAQGERKEFRLVTTVLDHKRLPVKVAARGYHLRWREETGIRELKWLRERFRVPHCPGQSPASVEQEYAGMLLAHSILRCLMAFSAKENGADPTRLSLSGTRAALNRFFARLPHVPPEHMGLWLTALLEDIARLKLPAPNGRVCPRTVKPKICRYPSKRRSIEPALSYPCYRLELRQIPQQQP